MFDLILVPTDGSALADKAINSAIEFARTHRSKIIGLSVAEPYPYSPLGESAFLPDTEPYDREMRERARQNVEKIAVAADRAQVPFETETVQSFDPADEIVKAAHRHGCDAIFIASHRRHGLNRMLMGSVTQDVLDGTDIPVVVFR